MTRTLAVGAGTHTVSAQYYIGFNEAGVTTFRMDDYILVVTGQYN